MATFLSFPSFAQNLSAKVIMEKNDEQANAKDEQMQLTMTLINSKGKQLVRKIEQINKTDNNKNRSSLIKFLAPADVKGTGFLSIEYTGKEEDQWLYLPALKKTRRISSSDETDNFMGSDFTFEDLGGEDLQDFDYKLLGSSIIDGADCYHIEATPNNDKKKKESGYQKREIFVRKDNYVSVSIKFYNKEGILEKNYKASEVKQVPGTDKWRAYRMELENLKTKHKTILGLQNVLINKGVQAELFTQRNLERGN